MVVHKIASRAELKLEMVNELVHHIEAAVATQSFISVDGKAHIYFSPTNISPTGYNGVVPLQSMQQTIGDVLVESGYTAEWHGEVLQHTAYQWEDRPAAAGVMGADVVSRYPTFVVLTVTPDANNW